MRRLLAMTLLACLGSGAARADAFTDAFTAELYAGRIAAAETLARDAAAGDPADATPQAALGLAHMLGAVEGLVQGFHRYGLNNGAQGYGALAMAGLPFLRVPVPDNPAPEPVSYQALRALLDDFAGELAEGEAVLDAVGDGRVAMELDLARIRLDFDDDGKAGEQELFLVVFATVGGIRSTDGWTVDLDAADAAWLQAYSNLLMALTDFLLAHDWEHAYDATFEGLFPRSFTPQTVLNALSRNAAERMGELQAKMPQQPECDPYPNGRPDDDCLAAYREWRDHPVSREIDGLRQATEWSSIADLIAFVHLLHWDVEDADRLRDARVHAQRTVRLSREMWRRVLAETDDAREWIPGPKQTGIFPTLPIDDELLAGWMEVLELFDDVLEGKLLLPHWRFEQGFNLRRMAEDPRAFDLVMLIHGRDVIPYLEDGPIADSTVWTAATRVFGGDFLRYFLYIN